MTAAIRRAVVITSIQQETDAVRTTMTRLDGWELFLVGDVKTPATWTTSEHRFLSVRDSHLHAPALGEMLPRNHYARKNIGYIAAIRWGATAIYDTDDDNAFLEGVVLPESSHTNGLVLTGTRWVNVYHWFEATKPLWPRGFPLDEINSPRIAHEEMGNADTPIQQFLANGDPDVDAVYRMIVGLADHEFNTATIIIGKGSYAPFNSQCTLWFPVAYPLLYLPSHVSFRMTDIWRSFVAQRCLQAAEMYLCYRGPAVKQERNDHDLARDFADEIPGYLKNKEIVEALEDTPLPAEATPAENLRRCYKELCDRGFIPGEELPLVDAWVADVTWAEGT